MEQVSRGSSVAGDSLIFPSSGWYKLLFFSRWSVTYERREHALIFWVGCMSDQEVLWSSLSHQRSGADRIFDIGRSLFAKFASTMSRCSSWHASTLEKSQNHERIIIRIILQVRLPLIRLHIALWIPCRKRLQNHYYLACLCKNFSKCSLIRVERASCKGNSAKWEEFLHVWN